MGNDSFTVLKATIEIESLVGATEICDSRSRNNNIWAVAGMDGVTMWTAGSLCFYISFHQWEHGGKPSNLSCPTDPVISILNFMRPSVLTCYQICTSLTNTETKSCDLLHHKAVQWLNFGRVLSGISLLLRDADHFFKDFLLHTTVAHGHGHYLLLKI